MSIYSIIDPRVQIQKMIPTANGKQITGCLGQHNIKGCRAENKSDNKIAQCDTHTNSKDCTTNACKWTKVDETVHIKMTNSGGKVQNYDSNQVWYLLD